MPPAGACQIVAAQLLWVLHFPQEMVMGSQLIQAPGPTEYDPHYATYIDPVARENVLEQLNRS